MTEQTLDERVQREKQFHDSMAGQVDLKELLVRETFESPTAIENHYIRSVFGDLRGKKILDLGCGAGESSVYFALQGASVTACDISGGLLSLSQALAKKYNVRILSVQADAGRIPCADDAFDYVYCNGVLHHVEVLGACREIHRVLKPGGKAAFIEPLPYNPLINLYRVMAQDVRTRDEKPLHFSQIRSISSIFPKMSHKEFWLFSLWLFIDFFLVRKWHPSKVRYWKKVIEAGPEYAGLFARLQGIDTFVLQYLPFLRPLCWNTVIVTEK